MANRPDPDNDDDFSELYKEYTGPPGSSTAQDRPNPNKRSNAGSDEEEEQRDPNAVPTDFTSREAKVWEAKSKATERNWKKRKEEEMICKICGESGHFTQGCPTTLGANRKSQDFFERVPAREKHVKALFTGKVIQRIENDVGCKIKMEEKFIIVSGRDRLILAKGVDAVHKVIKEEGGQKGASSSQTSMSRSPEQSPSDGRFRRSESQRSQPRDSPHFQQRFGRQDKVAEDRVREDIRRFPRGSPQAYGNNGARGRPSRSKSPARPYYAGNSVNSYDGHNPSLGGYRTDGLDIERRGSNLPYGNQVEYSTIPQTLEALELEYKREATELVRICDKEEDEENKKHRETIRDMRESYMNKLASLRGMHAKQWEEFLQLDAQRRQQEAGTQMSASGFGGYKQHAYSVSDGPSVNHHYAGASFPMDTRGGYPNSIDSYPSRTQDTYSDFQRPGREDFRKAYNRY
ncbi:uncharacterized protein LOC120000171 isoform X2 [Tripterygium wilfordii]|uniref:uncharacterized protein LOC120000171 isoform X2 n=1 Tax=Tripterygium wilfordii TaxID=458696 RepID=UPI0018F839AF|nr:uncharacterized protein LOC120000171 isoform X2 [Tripterygium wilfordii]